MTIARPPAWRALLCALLCGVFLTTAFLTTAFLTTSSLATSFPTTGATAAAGTAGSATPVRHVVIVGISGLRWAEVTPADAPVLWHLAQNGSAGDLADYAQQSSACPADGWLTLNAG
ncbi:MAG: hypothetical protein ACRDN0_01010, partial [Trebonia sp.]